jgi:hypothetical protein
MKATDAIKKTVDDAKDTLREAGHRGNAEGEKAKRELLGDEMTAGEKAKSVANQAKETVQAEYDAAKKDVRNHT